MESAQAYLIAGFLVSFLGTLPLGPINLAVVKTTVDHSRRQGIQVALAAALVEIIEFLGAFIFGQIIVGFLDSNKIIHVLIALTCIALAMYFVTRKPGMELATQSASPRSFYLRGISIAAVNPQAIPFWIFAVAALSQHIPMDVSGFKLGLLLAGVFAGKLLALAGFAYVSVYIKTHLRQSNVLVNRLLAVVLVLVGLAQLWKLQS